MIMTKTPQTASLLDIIIDGFEGGQGALETTHGWRFRQLPMSSETEAFAKFKELAVEALRWKGDGISRSGNHVEWPDLQIWTRGRGILVLVRDPNFDSWWHKPETWGGDDDDNNPMEQVYAAVYKRLGNA